MFLLNCRGWSDSTMAVSPGSADRSPILIGDIMGRRGRGVSTPRSRRNGETVGSEKIKTEKNKSEKFGKSGRGTRKQNELRQTQPLFEVLLHEGHHQQSRREALHVQISSRWTHEGLLAQWRQRQHVHQSELRA